MSTGRKKVERAFWGEPRRADPKGTYEEKWSPSQKRWTQLQQAVVDSVPSDGEWWEHGPVFSKGHAQASAWGINAGIYGPGVQAVAEPATLLNDAYEDPWHLYIRKRMP